MIYRLAWKRDAEIEVLHTIIGKQKVEVEALKERLESLTEQAARREEQLTEALRSAHEWKLYAEDMKDSLERLEKVWLENVTTPGGVQ